MILLKENMDFKQKELPRAEIRQDFSKDIKELTADELNSLFNNYHRVKAAQMRDYVKRMKELNPDFELQKKAHNFNREEREKILNFMQSIISNKGNEKDGPHEESEEYHFADMALDWYLAGQKEQVKKEEGLKTKEMGTN